MTEDDDTQTERVPLARDGWAVDVTLTRRGALAPWGLAEIACRPTDPAVTGRQIRALPFGELLTEAKAKAGGHALALSQPSDVALEGFRGGKRHRSNRDYAELAVEYAFRVQAGERNVPKALAARFGGDARTWSGRIVEARKRGLLTAPRKPREAGGEPTAAALQLLGILDDDA